MRRREQISSLMPSCSSDAIRIDARNEPVRYAIQVDVECSLMQDTHRSRCRRSSPLVKCVISRAAVSIDLDALLAAMEANQTFAVMADTPSIGTCPGRIRIRAAACCVLGAVSSASSTAVAAANSDNASGAVIDGQKFFEIAIQISGIDADLRLPLGWRTRRSRKSMFDFGPTTSHWAKASRMRCSA